MRVDCVTCGRSCATIERAHTPWDGPEKRWFEWDCLCGARGQRPVEIVETGDIL